MLGKLSGTAFFREDVSPSVFEIATRAAYAGILTVTDIQQTLPLVV